MPSPPRQASYWRKLSIKGRKGLGFYRLRHTHRTVSDATRDFPAGRLIMGHADGSIDDIYREHIDDGRLRRVVDYVRSWLFGDDDGATPDEDDQQPQQADKPEQVSADSNKDDRP